ncbi:MAG: DUF4397 domain-containing protein [Candidatus Dadabacteria bacterium]|nr:MAG: DUF4397 domain-containing protein [Candidatus Dadabacteria bacterium]
MSQFSKPNWFTTLLLVLAVTGCGGSSSPKTGLRVINAVLDSAPFQISNGSENISLGFAEISEIIPVNNKEPVSIKAQDGNFSFNLILTGEENSPLMLLYGSSSISGTKAKLLEHSDIKLHSGQAAVRIVNAVENSDEFKLLLNNAAVTSSPFGAPSEFKTVAAGNLKISVTDSLTETTVFSSEIETPEGQFYTVVLAGEYNLFFKTVIIKQPTS